jgi:predicted ATPase/DNA-binding NarL/FixJ family response regulator
MPVWRTPLIGRDDDRAWVRRLLLDAGHRLVVITGTGGVGKTRLAGQVAHDVQAHFRDGARFLPFASTPAGTDLNAAFAWHLGLRDVEGQTYRESIQRHLQHRQILLVIDNVEHLPHITTLLRFIQDRCPDVYMLVTSRSELDIYGEVGHQVPPLAVRPPSSLLPDRITDSALRSDAVRLFTARARAVRPDFAVTPDNAVDVVTICDLLGGLPLAIELTAPGIATRTPRAIRAELESAFDAAPELASPTLQARRSMQETIRLSYDRLSPDEQRTFRTLAIMGGHWTLDDVLPILTHDTDELDAIARVDALATSSLVYSSTGPDDELRFTLNPMLRVFGRDRLAETGETDAVAGRHADRMIALAEEAEPRLTGGGQQQWLTRIDALHEDFRGAHAWLLVHGRHVDALRMSTALWRYAYTRGHYREMRGWIESALAGVDDHDALRSRALNGVGLLANVIRDPAGARAAHEQALVLATRERLHREIGLSRIGLADIDASFEHDTDSAMRHLDLAAEAYEHLQDARALAGVLTNKGNIQWVLGQYDLAFAMHEEARVLYAQASDARGMAWSDTNTGRIAAQRRRYHEAVPRLRAALEGYVGLGDSYGLTEVLEALAAVAVGTDDPETALVLAGAATAMRATLGAALKSPDLEEFEATLAAARRCPDHEATYARGMACSPEEAVAIARAMPVPAPPETAADAAALARELFDLTPRQHEVLLLLADGLTNPEIAERLAISPRTVQTYLASIMHKLGVTSRVAAARAAHDAGIVPRQRDRPEAAAG